MIFLQVPIPVSPEKILEQSFNINPNNVVATAFGLLVAFCMMQGFIIYKFYTKREEDREKIIANEEKFIGVIRAEIKAGFDNVKEWIFFDEKPKRKGRRNGDEET